MIANNQEIFMALSMDNSGRITNSKIISKGSLTHAKVNPRDIAEFAFRNNATNLIIAHNHPNGMAIPSDDDLAFTENIVSLLRPFQVKIRDHIIFSDTDIFSMFEHKHTKGYLYTAEERIALRRQRK